MRDAAFFLKELAAAKKRETDYLKDGQRILEIYDGTRAHDTPFNILYSNTETMLPALYSRVPRPVVQRRFKDDDPLGRHAAQAGQRMLEFLVDTDLDGYETFDHGMTMAAKTALLPGRAITTVKYDAEEDGEDTYQSELACVQSKGWNRVRFGYATCWEKVPWVAYEEFVDQQEAVKLFGKANAALLNFTDHEQRDASEETKGTKEEPDQGEREVAQVWQIWDKDGGKRVVYVSEQVKDRFLSEADDPLGLGGFYNCPRPLMFVEKPHTLLPTALYTLYESQANELNMLTTRIKRIVRAIRARGLYDGDLGEELKKLTDADDTELVPTARGASLAADKGLDHAIWFWPVDKLIVVVRELYTAREACKQVIYEITGISDILRGATKASETLGAQEIKAQWGTLRLKRNQTAVAAYAVDLLRLMLEVAAKKFSEETWAKMTGLPFLTSATFTELTALMKAMESELMLRPAPPPQPSAPPDPLLAQLQQVQQQLQAPKWSDVLALLRDDLHRAYRIDIETNSTVEPEAAEDQKLLNEVLTTLSQVLAQVGPLVVKGVLPFQAAQTLLLTIVRRFRFGAELEETIKAMQPPQPEDDGMAQQVAQLEQQAAQAQMQAQQQLAEKDLHLKTLEAEKAILEAKIDLQLREIQLKADGEALAREKTALEAQFALKQQVQDAETSPRAIELRKSELQAERHTEMMKAKIQQETELAKAKIQAETQVEVARISAQAQKDKPKAVPA